MYARAVGKSISTDDRLVRRHGNTHQTANQATRRNDLARLDLRIQTEIILARLQRHNHFL